MACNHNWQAVAPVGVTELECPNCKTMKGHYIFAFAPAVNKVWECNCGNQLFHIALEGIFCPNCGVCQDYSRVYP
jgi:DNA-directed RNA polymerase subunit RPC12/RpoP